jgi:hypothetical protein
MRSGMTPSSRTRESDPPNPLNDNHSTPEKDYFLSGLNFSTHSDLNGERLLAQKMLYPKDEHKLL